jgi:hypothetical protein
MPEGINRATRINVATLGAIFGISGMSHGFFEMLQGSKPTEGFLIAAIGESRRMWPHGNEYAFTLIPNFLATGIAAMLIGFAVIVWSTGFAHRKSGAFLLLLLFILLLLTGGGVAQLLFFPWICLAAARINSPLAWWRKVLPANTGLPVGRIWLWCLVLSASTLVWMLHIAITGYIPLVNDPETVLSIMLACLLSEVLLLPLTFVFGFWHDLSVNSQTLAEGG